MLGSRPEVIKLVPVILAFQQAEDFQTRVVLTGQQRGMVSQVMDLFVLNSYHDLALKASKQITCAVLNGLREEFDKHRPDLVLVQGNTTIAFAWALAAFYEQITVGHVEAGLRPHRQHHGSLPGGGGGRHRYGYRYPQCRHPAGGLAASGQQGGLRGDGPRPQPLRRRSGQRPDCGCRPPLPYRAPSLSAEIMSTKETQKRHLVTGGAGFIGSRTCLTLLKKGYNVTVIDNFPNCLPGILRRVQKLADLSLSNQLHTVKGNIRCDEIVNRSFLHGIDAVIHFAGLKLIGESVDKPLNCLDVNINGILQLLKAMQERKSRTLVFSSSAALYGVSDIVPLQETASINPINPYSEIKSAAKNMLADLHESEARWRKSLFPYCNPLGAHPSCNIGENLDRIPYNLFPLLGQVALGKRKTLQIFGEYCSTHDGKDQQLSLNTLNLLPS